MLNKTNNASTVKGFDQVFSPPIDSVKGHYATRWETSSFYPATTMTLINVGSKDGKGAQTTNSGTAIQSMDKTKLIQQSLKERDRSPDEFTSKFKKAARNGQASLHMTHQAGSKVNEVGMEKQDMLIENMSEDNQDDANSFQHTNKKPNSFNITGSQFGNWQVPSTAAYTKSFH